MKSSAERPSNRKSPDARGLSRAKAVSSELLPAPDGPTKSTISPGSMAKDNPENMVRRSPSTIIEQRTFDASNTYVIDKNILIITVAAGVGFFLVVSMLRILFGFSLKWLFIVFYIALFALAAFADKEFLSVAFDSGVKSNFFIM